MKTTVKEYEKMYKEASPPSKKCRDFIIAFVVGGGICVIGQLFIALYTEAGADEKLAATLTSITLIALSALATGLGVYDKLAKRAGAGTLVPITGFANAVVSPALEFKNEGFVLGTGAKMFIIAGPVIVYGGAASVVAGIIYGLVKGVF